MLTFLFYSVFFGVCIVWPMMLTAGYYSEPAGRRSISYLEAIGCLLVCAIPLINLIIWLHSLFQCLTLIGPVLARKNLFSDKGEK